MHRKKKVKTTIVEHFKYDDDDDNGNGNEISMYPDLLAKLLWFARSESNTDEQLTNIVNNARLMMLDEDCLTVDHYNELIEPTFKTLLYGTSAPVTPVPQGTVTYTPPSEATPAA